MKARTAFPKTHPSATRLCITFLAVALIAVRKSDSLTNPQFWAEDGAIFFLEGEHYGGWNLLLSPYAGYLLLIPRLIAAFGAWVPLLHVPAFYAWSALAITGGVAWWLQSPRLNIPGGAVAALALAAVPHTGEVYLTLSNVQWITALGLFALVLADDAKTPATRFSELALLTVVGLTGPFILLTLPLFLWRTWNRRSPWSFVLLGTALACAAAHIPSLLARVPDVTAAPWVPLHHAAIIGRRVVVTLFFGTTPFPEILCAALAIATFTGLTFMLWRRRAIMPPALIVLTFAVLVLAATGYKERPDTWTLSELTNGDRYFFIPKILVLWLLAALALTSGPRLRPVFFSLLILPFVANAPRFLFPPALDQHWRASCELIARGQPVRVFIIPEGSSFIHPGRRHLAP
jgi:hypothetical protein